MRADGASISFNMTSQRSENFYSENTFAGKAGVIGRYAENGEQKAYPGEKKLVEAVKKSNPDIMGTSTNLEFSVHEKTKQVLVKIVDSNTKEVLKELPSEKILDMVANMIEKSGIFIDKRA